MRVCSRGGVCVHTDYRENIIVDADHPILEWKANKKNERLRPSWFPVEVRTAFPEGFPYIASEHSEDVLSWNVFRSLEVAGKLSVVTDMLKTHEDVEQLYFWQHAVSRRGQELDPEIQDVLNVMEPWGRNGTRQQTETDVILRGRSHIVVIESKLGKPDKMVKAWSRSGPKTRPMRSDYLNFIDKLNVKLFNDDFTFDRDGRRFHQLFRNYLLGEALCLKWNTSFSLLAIVNNLNRNSEGRSHEDEFRCFQSKLVQPSNTSLITWQQIWRVLSKEPQLARLREWLRSEEHTSELQSLS